MGKKFTSKFSDYESEHIHNVTKELPLKIELIFKENRSFDLHIGKDLYRFSPFQARKDIPKKVVDHKDFKNVKSKFIIKEIN